jgi:hypothetical protein
MESRCRPYTKPFLPCSVPSFYYRISWGEWQKECNNPTWLGPESNRLCLHQCYTRVILGRCGLSATEPFSLPPHAARKKRRTKNGMARARVEQAVSANGNQVLRPDADHLLPSLIHLSLHRPISHNFLRDCQIK